MSDITMEPMDITEGSFVLACNFYGKVVRIRKLNGDTWYDVEVGGGN